MTEQAVGGSRDYTVRCAECAAEVTYPAYRCPACAGPLVVAPAAVTAGDLPADRTRTGVWRRAALLPHTAHAVTLGEGDTPLLPLRSTGTEADRVRVLAKLESLNPTLSFKDRAMALASSVALDYELRGLLVASTGNAAVSAAAYAAAAGLPCRVLCGTGSGAGVKLAAATAHGAHVQLVEGDYSAAYRCAADGESDGWMNVSTTYRNPLLAEAYRGTALEIAGDLGHVPDVVVVPVGAGPLLRGLLGGFTDLVVAGAAERVPRMVGVQAAACAPLVRAWESGAWLASLTDSLPVLPTRAAAIADSLRGYEREGLLTLAAVRDSEGALLALTEDVIAAATTELAGDGLLVEPAAAAAAAAVRTPTVTALLPDGGTAVVVLTGHGAKEPMAATTAERKG